MIGERKWKAVIKNKTSSARVYDVSRGELLGKGTFREVSVFKFNPEYVIKFEFGNERGMFCNALEWRRWRESWHTPIHKWLAPVEFINETGQILIQKRVTFDGKYPNKIPWQFSDIHKANFGWIGKQFVCCDYAFLRSGYHPKFRNVKWKS